VAVAFRWHTLLPLDDCLYALQPTIPHLTCLSLHRYLQRHEISQLPQVEGEASPKRKFKAYPIGYFHLDIAEVQTAQGKLYLFVAIDRTSNFAVARLVDKANTQTERVFLEALVAAVPHRVKIVLTDDGIQFADLPKNRSGSTAMLRGHLARSRSDGQRRNQRRAFPRGSIKVDALPFCARRKRDTPPIFRGSWILGGWSDARRVVPRIVLEQPRATDTMVLSKSS
jgi:hypothetical protein